MVFSGLAMYYSAKRLFLFSVEKSIAILNKQEIYITSKFLD